MNGQVDGVKGQVDGDVGTGCLGERTGRRGEGTRCNLCLYTYSM